MDKPEPTEREYLEGLRQEDRESVDNVELRKHFDSLPSDNEYMNSLAHLLDEYSGKRSKFDRKTRAFDRRSVVVDLACEVEGIVLERLANQLVAETTKAVLNQLKILSKSYLEHGDANQVVMEIGMLTMKYEEELEADHGGNV